MTAREILECGHPATITPGPGTGYGKNAAGERACYDCCADIDQESMRKTGRATLYLAHDDNGRPRVTNWPGSLVFIPSTPKIGRHNIAGRRYDIWFSGPGGAQWHGVQYGDNTQILHCRRLKGTGAST